MSAPSSGRLFARRINWRKRGLILSPRPELPWWRSHAMIPTPERIEDGIYRIYFSGRDDRNRSHIGWALIDFRRPNEVLDYSAKAVLAPGRLGCFDDNGVTPSCIIQDGSDTHLYYIGWNPGSTVRMHLFGGLAIRRKGQFDFTRWSEAPIIERSRTDPFLNTAPFVIRDGAVWRMYYVSGVGWEHKDLPRYHIRWAESSDGKIWDRRGSVAIDFAGPGENALARPFVLHEGGIFKMWFAHKGEAYRLGYAESADGKDWTRDDSFAGLTVSDSGWDSDMVEYAAIIECDGRKLMLYNGNDYGRGGFGLAEES